jgi:HD domain
MASGTLVANHRVRRHHVAASIKRLAQVATATLLVVGCPVATAWWLRASGTISSAAIGAVVGMALSLCASQVGRVLWEKLPGSEDVLFSELMLWGFVHRWHTQRRLASAHELLGPMGGAQQRAVDGLSTKQQAKLLEQLVTRLETRDPYLHGHSRRVARHAWMIARRMGLPREEVARIRTAAAIHDVGKVETPKAILHKPGPLTADEYEVIKKHPGDGALMVTVLRDPELTAMVRHHHERLDGTGYPGALSGSEIPLGARIIAVADTFDAITSTRPYRAASPHKKAIDTLRHESGTRLDPAAVRAFCAHYAGRRPIFLWASVAGLPERVVSWLGGSLASVASAAKMAAVALLVGGLAGTTSTLAVPVTKSRSTNTHSGTTAGQSQAARATLARVSPSTMPGAVARSQHVRTRHAAGTSSVHRGSPSLRPPASSAAGVVGVQPASSGTAGGSTQGAALGANKATHVKETHGAGEESHSSGKVEAPRGKSQEAHGKSQEAHGKSEEAHGKSEEAHGKSEEAHGKSEGAQGKSEEAHGKSEEPHAPAEVAHGKSEEPHAPAEVAHGKSEEPHAPAETPHGKP